MNVYLVDLTHTTVTVSVDTFPLGIGYLAAYAAAHCSCRPTLRLFRFLEDYQAALMQAVPDVVAVANYAWNYHLDRYALRLARARNPQVLAIMGGPNLPLSKQERQRFMELTPEVDLYIPGEAELAFAGLLDAFAMARQDRRQFLGRPWHHGLCRGLDGQVTVDYEPMGRVTDVEQIPSPYLTGFMDVFFGQKLHPIIEGTRGCPFTCTYCVAGGAEHSQVRHYTLERIRDELLYIRERVKPADALTICDSDFGLYERDLEVAALIGGLQAKTGWPQYVNCTTAVHKPERVIEAIDRMHGATVISSSVQSMNPEVLRNIKRMNIPLDRYAQAQQEIRKRGLKSMADMILCLPGETQATHFSGVRQLLELGVQRILPFQLMLLNGTEIATQAARQCYGFETRFRVVPRNFSRYAGELVAESEEIVVATNTLAFSEYLECRRLHLLLEIYLKEEPFAELFVLAAAAGISKSDVIFAMWEQPDAFPADLAALFAMFEKDTRGELFATRDQLVQYLSSLRMC